ncbi:MAG: YqgE/AlgH family protein [Cellvibrio sp.]|jgi:Putative transcriptional regulator
MTTYDDLTKSELTAGSLRDHFLIAMPGMRDSAFAHAVTYICEHTEKGAMGIVINNAMPLFIRDIFVQMELTDQAGIGNQAVFAGGPVQIERGFVLHSSEKEWQSTLKISPRINLTASRDIIEALAEGRGPEEYLIALGYAGWGEGQLEAEVAANSWLTLPADSNIIFHTPPEQRWAAAAQPLGIDLNLISSVAGHA